MSGPRIGASAQEAKPILETRAAPAQSTPDQEQPKQPAPSQQQPTQPTRPKYGPKQDNEPPAYSRLPQKPRVARARTAFGRRQQSQAEMIGNNYSKEI